MDKPQAISVHFGVNRVKGLPVDEVPSCGVDAETMRLLAAERGFTATAFTDGAPTIKNLRTAIKSASEKLESGDYFLLTFSGHGFAIEVDGRLYQSLCFRDNTLWRHGPGSLDSLLEKFETGVRVLVVLNACFSGSDADANKTILLLPREAIDYVVKTRRLRLGLPSANPFVAFMQRIYKKLAEPTLKAFVIEIAAAGGRQVAAIGNDPKKPTPFIARFVALERSSPDATFEDFVLELRKLSPSQHMPNWTPFEPRSARFEEIGPLEVPDERELAPRFEIL